MYILYIGALLKKHNIFRLQIYMYIPIHQNVLTVVIAFFFRHCISKKIQLRNTLPCFSRYTRSRSSRVRYLDLPFAGDFFDLDLESTTGTGNSTVLDLGRL